MLREHWLVGFLLQFKYCVFFCFVHILFGCIFFYEDCIQVCLSEQNLLTWYVLSSSNDPLISSLQCEKLVKESKEILSEAGDLAQARCVKLINVRAKVSKSWITLRMVTRDNFWNMFELYKCTSTSVWFLIFLYCFST